MTRTKKRPSPRPGEPIMTRESLGRQFVARSTALVAIVAASTFAFPAGPSPAAEPSANPVPKGASAWKAGVAKAVITPEKAVWLAGYGSKRPPDGKLHDLWMKALALEDAEGRRAVLITSDFQGVPKGMSDRVFEQLTGEVRAGAAPGDVHLLAQPLRPAAGRRPGRLLSGRGGAGQAGRRVHRRRWSSRRVAMVGEALAKLAPASLQIGEGQGDLRRQPPQQPRGRRPGPAGQRASRWPARSITPCRC